MTTRRKIMLGVIAALGTGLGGYLLGYQQLRNCQGDRKRDEAKIASISAELTHEQQRFAQAIAEERRQRALVLAQAELLHALLEVRSKNFGLASKHIEASSQQIAAGLKSTATSQRTGDLLKTLSNLHERVLLLDARVVSDLKHMVSELHQLTRTGP